MPPDINQSSFTFIPNSINNTITYGLRGITRVSSELIHQIIDNRPYESLEDFLKKNHTNKLQTLNLIKAGAFDSLYECSREEILHNYLDSITDKKQRLTLQNMAMLISKNLIPEEMKFYEKLFSFNKFLKQNKSGIYYNLNEAAVNFIDKNFSLDLTVDGIKIEQKVWDNTYKKAMNPMRDYLKENNVEMLQKLNQSLYGEVAEKYAEGNISKWEMDSISFYYHDHELLKFKNQYDDFFTLPEEPIIENSFVTKDGKEINIVKLFSIIGTVIDKDKIRNTITLLTPTGVVTVRIYKNQYSIYDRQISERGEDGVKHVKEPSWFRKGTLLWVQGFRRGNDFIPRKRKSSPYPIIMKIINAEKDELEFQAERAEVS